MLVIKGQCDYLDRESATGYLTAFPDSRPLYPPGAGQDVHVDEPRRVLSAIEEFLAGRAVSGILWNPVRPPASFER